MGLLARMTKRARIATGVDKIAAYADKLHAIAETTPGPIRGRAGRRAIWDVARRRIGRGGVPVSREGVGAVPDPAPLPPA